MRVVYLPSNLDLDALIKLNPPRFDYSIENFKFLLGTIVRLNAQYKGYTEEETSEYVPLHSTILQSRVRDYNHYLKYLLDNKIIEKDYYIPGEKATGYKLADKYFESDFRYTELNRRNLTRKGAKEAVEKKRLHRQYGYLTKWFNEKLEIDCEGAYKHLQELLLEEQKKGDSKAKKKYYLRKVSVDKLAKCIFDYSVDDTVRRFHSNLTNLKSELRNFITYDGQKLCSIDVANSQPFISTILLNPEFYSRQMGSLNLITLSSSIYKAISPYISNILSIISKFSSFIMLVKSDETQCSNDLELYCTLVDKGRLYQYLSEQYEKKTGFKLDVGIPEEKKKLKQAIFLTLFSDNRFIGQKEAEMKRFFSELFPTVYEIFCLIKRKGNHLLPIILQLIESEIVLNRVAGTIAKAHPTLPIFTIHDSVVTLVQEKEIVWGVVKREFENAIGLKPYLNIEVWDAPKPLNDLFKFK